MSAFVPLPAAAENPAPAPLPASGFWPAVDFDALRAAVRIDPTVTTDRLRDSGLAARLQIAAELDAWRQVQEAAGFATLDQVPNPRGPQLAAVGVTWSEALYFRALASLVAADMADRTRDAATSLAGNDRADAVESTADVHRRNYRHALSDLQGRGRSTIELI